LTSYHQNDNNSQLGETSGTDPCLYALRGAKPLAPATTDKEKYPIQKATTDKTPSCQP